MKLKETGFFGNLVVATCLGMLFITGALAAGRINGIVLTFAALAFFFDLGEEMASDAMDVKGDEVRLSKSLAKVWGRTLAMKIAGLMFMIFFVLTLLPFFAGWLGYDYLVLIALTDLFMGYSALALVKSREIGGGRLWIRRLVPCVGIIRHHIYHHPDIVRPVPHSPGPM